MLSRAAHSPMTKLPSRTEIDGRPAQARRVNWLEATEFNRDLRAHVSRRSSVELASEIGVG